MADGIIVRILGDYGPFSRIGKSVGYQVTIGQSNYFVDCGAPLFQQIGGHGLKNIDGLIITHCHEDHKRWFSDLALFHMYAPDISNKVKLFTAENINEEIMQASGPALDRSLSSDAKSIVDISYDEYINFNVIGPLPRYKIVPIFEGKGGVGYYINDENGDIVSPDTAKIIINPKTKRPRMLFRDPNYKEWVEPDSFYPFSSTVFYERNQNIYRDEEGCTIQAFKSAVWHGVPTIGIKIKTEKETLVFSADTVHDKELWTQLYTEKKIQKTHMSKKEFESAPVIFGNINDYIERTWSEERYINAINAFSDAVVIHDVAARKSVVHTDYDKLKTSCLRKDRTLLTHSPDKMTSEWVLCNSGKTYEIKENNFYERVDGRLLPMDADVYHREDGRYFVGYKNENGQYLVYEKEGVLGLVNAEAPRIGTPLYRIDVYEDISGKYFPKVSDANTLLYERKDGKVERLELSEYGSAGKIVDDVRGGNLKKS